MSDNSSMDSGPVVNDPVSTPVLGMGQPASNIYARALYTFKGKKDSYLSFTKGDVITITEQQEQWSHGQLNGQQGWLPNSYIKVEESQAATAAGGASSDETRHFCVD
jgi:myosin I